MNNPAFLPIGLLGGAFDPIHYGHLRLAEQARESLALAQVRLVPTGFPPHRETPQISAEQRLALAKKAVERHPQLLVDDIEVADTQKSYTVKTLSRLRERFGDQQPLIWILGADAFSALDQWYCWEQLFELAHIAVANRPGYLTREQNWDEVLSDKLIQQYQARYTDDVQAIAQSASGKIIAFDMIPLEISSSQIRDLYRTGLSTRYLLPEAVIEDINQQRLYR